MAPSRVCVYILMPRLQGTVAQGAFFNKAIRSHDSVEFLPIFSTPQSSKTRWKEASGSPGRVSSWWFPRGTGIGASEGSSTAKRTRFCSQDDKGRREGSGVIFQTESVHHFAAGYPMPPSPSPPLPSTDAEAPNMNVDAVTKPVASLLNGSKAGSLGFAGALATVHTKSRGS